MNLKKNTTGVKDMTYEGKGRVRRLSFRLIDDASIPVASSHW